MLYCRFSTLLVCLYLLASSVRAQVVEFPSALFWTTYSFSNPGATGIDGTYALALNGRDQYSGNPENINTLRGLFAWNLDSINSAVGVTFSSDQYKNGTDQRVRIQYAYAVQFGASEEVEKRHRLRFGLAADYASTSNDFRLVSFTASNDPIVNEFTDSDAVFDLALGFTYRFQGLTTGFAVSQLLQPTFRGELWSIERDRNFRFHGTYRQAISKSIAVRPGILIHTTGLAAYSELSLVTLYNDRFWLGGLYNSLDGTGILGGFAWKDKYRLTYLYEHYLDHLRGTIPFLNSHELTLSMVFD